MTCKIAMMYDFDETLCTKNMQEYSLLDNLGVSAAEFWGSVGKTARECNMDPTLTYMYLLVKQAEKQGIMLRRENFQALGKNIEYYPGVETFFKRINEYGASLGAEIHHFIISSGTKEILEGCSIYDEFTKVFASEFHYDHNGNADWPALSINYTGKTQFLFRINKNALEIYDSSKVNEKIAQEDRDIPFTNMMYFGDGMTDVPCMKLVKSNGGYAIGVYTNEKPSKIKKLLEEERVNIALPADYTEGSLMETSVKKIIQKMVLDNSLKNITL